MKRFDFGFLVSILAAFLISTMSFAEESDEGGIANADCVTSVYRVYQDFAQAWSYAINEPGSRARDAIFSTQDYGRVYWEVMRRVPQRSDRTKGLFMELRDRVDYTYRVARQTPWYDYRIWQLVQRGVQDTNYLAWCYGAPVE